MIWWILYGLATILLLLHWGGGQNAVWGAATCGAFVGVVIAVVATGFDGWIVARATAIGAIVGTVFEWAPRLLSRQQEAPPGNLG